MNYYNQFTCKKQHYSVYYGGFYRYRIRSLDTYTIKGTVFLETTTLTPRSLPFSSDLIGPPGLYFSVSKKYSPSVHSALTSILYTTIFISSLFTLPRHDDRNFYLLARYSFLYIHRKSLTFFVPFLIENLGNLSCIGISSWKQKFESGN